MEEALPRPTHGAILIVGIRKARANALIANGDGTVFWLVLKCMANVSVG